MAEPPGGRRTPGRAGEAEPEHVGERRRRGRGLLSGALEHALHGAHVDGVDLQRWLAGTFDAVLAVAADQAEQAVDLAHAGPGQGAVEQPGGVGADGDALRYSMSRMA
jgi:hypothetical protein